MNIRRNTKYGLSKDIKVSKLPLYATYRHILYRCYDKENPNFEGYGSRGIKVCARWRFGENGKSGLECFIEDVGERPKGMTLDRRDNDGNYSCGHCWHCRSKGWPANCKWSTAKEQRANQRPMKNRLNRTSQYRGVCWNNKASKWFVQLRIENGESMYLGIYEEEVVAALAYDLWVVANCPNGTPTNFPWKDLKKIRFHNWFKIS